MIVFFIIFGLFIVFENLVVFFVVFSNKILWENIYYNLVFFFLVSDLLFGVNVIFFGVI